MVSLFLDIRYICADWSNITNWNKLIEHFDYTFPTYPLKYSPHFVHSIRFYDGQCFLVSCPQCSLCEVISISWQCELSGVDIHNRSYIQLIFCDVGNSAPLQKQPSDGHNMLMLLDIIVTMGTFPSEAFIQLNSCL